MKSKSLFIVIGTIVIVLLVLLGTTKLLAATSHPTFQTDTVAVTSIKDQISAVGTIHSQNEAVLHFQTGGKVTYLPYKVGDTIYQGATIAQLDTYALQKQLQIAANAYAMAKNNSDQAQENNTATILEGQTRLSLDTTNHNGYANSPITEVQVIADTINRLVDNSILSKNTAQLQVDLSNYALQLSSLTSPINGVITAEDITVPNVNITPATSFSIADPSSPILKAHVAETDIDYVTTGADVLITLNGLTKQLSGTVTQIEPQKITDTTGSYYIVDITSDDLKQYGKLGQTANVLIANTQSGEHLLIPTWTILGHNYVWVLDGGHPVLKKITVGKTHGQNSEVLNGISPEEKVIINPQAIAKSKYSIL